MSFPRRQPAVSIPSVLSIPLALIAFAAAPTLSAAASASSELRLPAVFSDNAVLQQGREVPVWGWCGAGDTVSVEFRGKAYSTVSKNGRWLIKLPRQRPGLSETLVVRAGNDTLTRTNILVGEVWVCSGQSNMEWPLSRSEDPQPAIEASSNKQLRLFTVTKNMAATPAEDVEGRWELCNPATVARFSAVAYYFGVDLQRARNVPVGLIHTSWGGSPAEVWIREEVLAADPAFKRNILDPYPEKKRRFEESVAAWEKEVAELRAQGKAPVRGRPWGDWAPSQLYNGMIYPLIPYAIAGAIWYQGESNASRAHEYGRLFPTLIKNWRADWGQGEFPFLAVQLAPWDKNKNRSEEEITATPMESDWAELREAQLMSTRVLPKVGMAVITDVGDKDDIHPTKKRPVGARLALAARAIAYNERITYSGPIYRSLRISRGRAIISFQHVGSGLQVRGKTLKGFQICGTNREWRWADARIDGRRVVVTHPDVPEPVAVRYGWLDYPVVNLFNVDGLPASPFRTDNFPMVTAPKD
ncbi:MAG: sialate O-acetylesterase [Limisphaerales bacterium]